MPQTVVREVLPEPVGTPPDGSSSAAAVARHDLLTRALHWVFAVGIIYATIVGYALHLIAPGPLHTMASRLNMSLASVLIVLFPLRLWWRMVRRQPAPPAGLTPAQLRPARMVQNALYAVIGEVLVSGYLMVPKSYRLFGLMTVPTPFDGSPPTHQALRLFFWAHRVGCATLAGLIVLHVAGVIVHTMIRPVGLLRRMV